MKILGIDPGMAIVGYGIIEVENDYIKLAASGSIQTCKDCRDEERLLDIFTDLSTILEEYKPDCASIEKLYFFKNQKTIIPVAEARGVILLSARKFHVPVFEYTPLQVKTAVTGYGKAQKYRVMEMTRRLLNLKSVPKPDDTADALAIAIAHTQAAGTDIKKLMINRRNRF